MKVIVTAPRGKMGKLITQVAASRDDMELVAGIGPKGRDYIVIFVMLALSCGIVYLRMQGMV